MLILMILRLTRTCSAVAWLYTMLPSSLNFCAFEKMRSTSAAQALDVLYSCRFILDYEGVRDAPLLDMRLTRICLKQIGLLMIV
jgi:hypothetical protein